jgi:acetaldehyde dehydrogenase (acetylating)
MAKDKLKIAIIGSGNIGTDLLIKAMRSEWLECTKFIGRNLSSPGMKTAIDLGVPISDKSIDALIQDPNCCDLVFDATSAIDAKRHWLVLEKLGKTVVDMTPSNIGKMCIPAVNIEDTLQYSNVNMVTCGGQASIPIAHCIGKTHKDVTYIEVVSSIASKSAGPATRLNLDEYVDTTELGIRTFSGSQQSKAILNLNPAYPCIDMQTTIFAKVKQPNIEILNIMVLEMVEKIKKYVPGYELIVPPLIENGRIVVMVKVKGLGDYLPKYAGNLDIINCAAIAVAEQYAHHKLTPVV